jgi:hypothetical protein
MSNLNYVPKTEAGRVAASAESAVNSAHLQWLTFAGYVAKGYTIAYSNHAGALEKIQQILKGRNDFNHFLLSLVCVSLGGGIVGGVMAPWIAKAGSDVLQNALRTGVSGSKGSGAQMIIQRALDAVKADGTAPFKPIAMDPFSKYLDLTNGIGLLFSMIRDVLKTGAKMTDEGNMPVSYGELARDYVLEMPLIAKAPGTNDFPAPEEVARQAELGMWIAWAHKRDIGYWTKRVKAVTDRSYAGTIDWSYKAELLDLGPIADRLTKLGAIRALSKVDFGLQGINNPSVGYHSGETFVDIPKLKQLGAIEGGPFYENLHAMMNPTTAINALERLSKVPPVFARKKGYYDAY